jgi:hypothetical protein
MMKSEDIYCLEYVGPQKNKILKGTFADSSTKSFDIKLFEWKMQRNIVYNVKHGWTKVEF